MALIEEILNQSPYLFIQPMLYVGIILVILQYRRQILLERKLFSSRIHSLPLEVIRSLGYGIFGGLLASSLMIGIGVVFHPTEMWIVWIITMILVLFHIRFLCLSYATGILGVIVGIAKLLPITEGSLATTSPWLLSLLQFFQQMHIPSLIAIVAILHLVEGVLIRMQASKQATPLFVESKRGKLVGGYHLQSYWILPMFLIVSTGTGEGGFGFTANWWPLIGGSVGAGASGLAIFPVPAMIGYSDLTTAYSSSEKSKSASNYLFIYSILLLGFAFLSEYWAPIQIIAALFAALGHEWIRFIGRFKEGKMAPRYAHPKDGLKILAIIPNTPASRMKILEGEVIKKVNGYPVTNRKELHHALQLQSAFTKLEILDKNQQIKMVQTSIYQNDHHQLGILLAPDEDSPYHIEVNNLNLLKLLDQKITKVFLGEKKKETKEATGTF